MSLLTIIQAAADRLGVARPNAVMSSGEEIIRVMRTLATQEGRELASRATWQRLTKEQSFTSIASETQTNAIPSDFDRFITETCWNYTQQEPMIGPLEPQEWQALKASSVGPADWHYRIRGNDFIVVPVPTAGETIKFEYVSKNWVDTNADGVGDADAWASDTDTAVLSEELITLGVIWRWLKRNRMPYADEFQEYTAQVTQAIARDGGKRTVNVGRRYPQPGARGIGVNEGNWVL